ncbi:Bug family tripartite tricarboxylate transporter substrate binding protein [Bradyrhizobium commune]|uniref:Tripartite tricarboxylate transporter substrate binding protein n=1 Tax=Bradyrhizobium commune TaxID=83627 RepID=A0A7S9GZ48_9BRAD|nr:tripartite tricarboxylate transporter substrate binding protein [Bradyrhizobium commune]QPF91153.1 tripartite tricarboxylate transporter substrate binding protein [Bradyrhizobium commune]
MALKTTRRAFIATGAATIALSYHDRGWTQTWPSRPIKIICGYPAGGLTDSLARIYGEYLSQRLSQSVVVENKAGASGSIAAAAVKQSPHDGYTLLVANTVTLAQSRVLVKSLPYDADKDFVLISCMPAGPLPFVAAKATNVTNLKELVDYARKNETNVGTWGPGSLPHIAVAELNKQYDLRMKAVFYRGEAPMWQDFAAGVLQAAMGSYTNTVNALESGTGKAIALPARTRSSKLPDVPTFAEQGVDSRIFALTGYIFLAGPAGMPQEIVERLSDLMIEAGRTDKIQKLLDSYGIDESAQGHIAFRKLYDSETPIWVDATRALGLAPE